MLLSDIDSKWHDTVEAQKTYYAPDFKPDFWLVNGRAYPDTLKPHPLTITSPNANTNLTQLNYESLMNKKFSNYSQYCTDPQLKTVCSDAANIHRTNFNSLKTYLESHQ